MKKLLLLLVCIYISACTTTIPSSNRLKLAKVDFADLPDWGQDDYKSALYSFINSCNKLTFSSHKLTSNSASWYRVCNKANDLLHSSNESILEFFEYNFVPFKIQTYDKDICLFTGYYEAILNGSRKPYGPYKYPIYNVPNNMVKGTKPISREFIEKGTLKNSGLEIVYVDDKIDLFFLHIQGSGRVNLDDGSTIKIGYKDQNGHPYTPIGRYISKNYNIDIDKISAPFIKNWLRTNKQHIAENVMNQNASYVFFQEMITPYDNPIGGQGVALTPERSLAVDINFIPYGMPIWIDTHYPHTPNCSKKPLRKLMIAQDKGGAIKGPLRADIFFGRGKQAEELAGYMKQKGQYYVLLPIAKE
ncbi:Membrane-bound lytic murein transglycosylase A precursor [Rickettsiales bacterium Ac37b]|nr:Membrane-bound lytic murein transglycosylase A precursor [Rickettsiales bacterium Ac37b]